MYPKKWGWVAAAIACTFVISCGGAKSPDLGSTLWGSLGGAGGASKLMHSFGKQLSENSALSQQLGKAGIDQVQRGLYNSLGQTAGYEIPKGTDLMSVLKDKKLDKAGVDAVGSSLKAAASAQNLKTDQMAMLNGMWEPIAKKLM